MIEGVFQILGDAYLDFALNGRERRRTGNRHAWKAPHNVYPCAGFDRWIAIEIESDEQWQALCWVMDRTDLGDDPRYRGALGRHQHQEEIDAAVRAWSRDKDAGALQTELQQAGVPAGAALNGLDLLKDPHALARGTFIHADTPGVGLSPYARVPSMPPPPTATTVQPAPRYGANNEEICRGLLGLTAAEYDHLQREKVITSVPQTGME